MDKKKKKDSITHFVRMLPFVSMISVLPEVSPKVLKKHKKGEHQLRTSIGIN